MNRADLAKALGLDDGADSVALYQRVREALGVVERPSGIDPSEERAEEVEGHRFRFGFVRRVKVIHWEGERKRLAHQAAAAIGADLMASAAGDTEAQARIAAKLHTPEWADRYATMADIHARGHELHREIVRYGVRGWEIPGCAEAVTEKAGRDVMLTEDSVDLLESRGLVQLLALAVLGHWTLTDAEKKS